jgi:hypothetical protein
MNYPKADTGKVLPEMSKFINSDGFKFDCEKEPSIQDFEEILGETVPLMGKCVLNEKKFFPLSKRKFISGPDFDGKLIDYLGESPDWSGVGYEHVYCITFDKKIVKIGMSTTNLEKRFASYSCGTEKNMEKGSCSTTNFILTQNNYHAVLNEIEVEIFGIRIPIEYRTIERWGREVEVPLSMARGIEELVTDIFIENFGHKPILCVQKGKSTKKK